MAAQLSKWMLRLCWFAAAPYRFSTWWRHQMETFFALLALCAWNSPATGEFPSQRPVTRSFDVRLNKGLSKQSRRRWFKTPSRSLWRHCNECMVMQPINRHNTVYKIIHDSEKVWLAVICFFRIHFPDQMVLFNMADEIMCYVVAHRKNKSRRGWTAFSTSQRRSMRITTSTITDNSTVYSEAFSGEHQSKCGSDMETLLALLALVWGIQWWPVDSSTKDQ